jgi:hypothetical protein
MSIIQVSTTKKGLMVMTILNDYINLHYPLQPSIHTPKRRILQPTTLNLLPHPPAPTTTTPHRATNTIPIKRDLRTQYLVPSDAS